jgi:hypothetical protein
MKLQMVPVKDVTVAFSAANSADFWMLSPPGVCVGPLGSRKKTAATLATTMRPTTIDPQRDFQARRLLR